MSHSFPKPPAPPLSETDGDIRREIEKLAVGGACDIKKVVFSHSGAAVGQVEQSIEKVRILYGWISSSTLKSELKAALASTVEKARAEAQRSATSKNATFSIPTYDPANHGEAERSTRSLLAEGIASGHPGAFAEAISWLAFEVQMVPLTRLS